MDQDVEVSATFIEHALSHIAGIERAEATILDFGCGAGQLVQRLATRGFDVYGCDVVIPPSGGETCGRLRMIPRDPYRLPFQDASFNAVFSTSVLEHAQNKEQCFKEIHRVLKPGGCAMHLFPAKWYLPYEPHILVPLVNYLWPHCPQWWLALWAILGVRNEFQGGMSWREVVKANRAYCAEGLSYVPTSRYRRMSLGVFGNCEWPMKFYIENAEGGFASLSRKLPFKGLAGLVSREGRMSFLVQRKT
jgi:SAM-dependent methyltransferase